MRLSLRVLAAGLQLASYAASQDTSDEAVYANLEKFWSYGRSPAVYPTRKLVI